LHQRVSELTRQLSSRSNLRVRFAPADDYSGGHQPRARSAEGARSRRGSGGTGATVIASQQLPRTGSFTGSVNSSASASDVSASVGHAGTAPPPPPVVHRRVLLTATVVNGLPLALDAGSPMGSRTSTAANGSGKRKEEFSVGPPPSQAALAAADGVGEECRQRSKDFAKRMQQEVLKKNTLAVIDALLAKHTRLRHVRRCTLRDSLDSIRAEEEDIRALIAEQKQAKRVKVNLFVPGCHVLHTCVTAA
jgi:hypothetical protein